MKMLITIHVYNMDANRFTVSVFAALCTEQQAVMGLHSADRNKLLEIMSCNKAGIVMPLLIMPVDPGLWRLTLSLSNSL